MNTSTTSNPFRKGVVEGAPFLLVIIPFALLFGVVASEAGLNILETTLFSVTVTAGASQFAALQLLTEDAPVWVALLSALAVNLRLAMYSASLTPWLGEAPLLKRAFVAYLTVDQNFALADRTYEERDDWGIGERLSYFFGLSAMMVPFWIAFTTVGALIGQALPSWLPLDFAVPITFLAMIGPALRTRAHVAAAALAAFIALLLAGLPFNMGLFVGAISGMVVGAEWERRAQDIQP